MSEWIDLTVYVMLTIAIWFLLPTWGAKFTVLFVHDRNPEWLHAHPAVAAALRGYPRWNVVWYAWGLVSSVLLFAFQAGLWPSAFARFTTNAERWEALKDLNALLLGLGALSIIAVWAAFTMWLRRIPCANRRHATLTRRTLDDIVPRGVRVVMYAAIGVTLAAWIATAVVNVPGTPRFWGRLAALAVVLGTVVFFISFSVRRPPHAMDRLFGPAYRADEVRFAFSLLLLIPLGGAVRLYEELNNTTVTDLNRLMHLAVALLVTIWAVRLTSYSTGTSGGSQANAGRLVPNRAERARGRHRLLLRETFMKTVLRSFVFAAVLGTAASAQGPNLLGNWQGVLQAGPQQLRIVVVITSGEGGRPAATLYSIDQTPTGTAGSVTLQGSAIRISVPTLGATFDGKLSADGNSIPGTFAQGPVEGCSKCLATAAEPPKPL